jgi:hypothetical protein
MRRICAGARMRVFVRRHVQVILGCHLWWCE